MFESAYGEMKSEMLDHQQTFFRSVEESENKFNDAVINIAEQWVKQAQEGNLDAVSDELAAVSTGQRPNSSQCGRGDLRLCAHFGARVVPPSVGGGSRQPVWLHHRIARRTCWEAVGTGASS